MKRIRRFFAVLILLASVCGAAAARDADGRLWFILNPVSTRPVFVLPGGEITAIVSESLYDSAPGPLRVYLVKNGARIPVETGGASASSGGIYRFHVGIPGDTATGLYGLVVQKGELIDNSRRAVMVLDKYPDEYTIMHITDTHVGRMVGDEPRGEAYYEKIAARANMLKPDIVVITGDNTDSSEPDEFRKFLEITDRIESTTVVVAGNHDREHADAHTWLGPGRFTFMFGSHFFLGFDTQYHFPTPDPEGNLKWIIRKVKSNRDAPFKVIFSHREESDFRMIISNVIVPYEVDLFLSGHYHAGGDSEYGTLPSRYLITRAALEGYYRIIRVGNNAVQDIETQSVNN